MGWRAGGERLGTSDRVAGLGAIGAVAVFGAAVAVLVPLFAVYHDSRAAGIGDGSLYVRMADDPGRFVIPPFGYRILSPRIVSALPLDTRVGFQVLTVVSLAAASVLVMMFVQLLYGSRWRSMLAWVLFLCSPCVWLSLTDPYSSDPLAYVAIAASFILILRREWAAVVVVTTIGVLTRETAAFVILPALVACLASGESRRRIGIACAALIGVPAAAYLLLHYTPILFERRSQYNYFSLETVRIVWDSKSEDARSGPEALISGFYRSWSVMWLALPFLLTRASRVNRIAACAYLVPVVVSIIFANSWIRMLAFAFPVMIGLTCAIEFSAATATLFAVSYAVSSLVLAHQPGSTLKYLSEAIMLLVSGVAVTFAVRRHGTKEPVLVESTRPTTVPAGV